MDLDARDTGQPADNSAQDTEMSRLDTARAALDTSCRLEDRDSQATGQDTDSQGLLADTAGVLHKQALLSTSSQTSTTNGTLTEGLQDTTTDQQDQLASTGLQMDSSRTSTALHTTGRAQQSHSQHRRFLRKRASILSRSRRSHGIQI